MQEREEMQERERNWQRQRRERDAGEGEEQAAQLIRVRGQAGEQSTENT
jgi:hypothetical protein